MEENKIVLPAIAVRGIVPLPNNDFKIEIGRTNSVMALDSAEKMYGGNVILLIQKDASTTDVTKDDVEEYGVLAKISLKLKLPNGNYKVKFKIANRVKVLEYTQESPYFVVSYDKVFSLLNNDEFEAALIKNVASEISKNSQNVLINIEEVSKLLQSGTNADTLSDVIAFNLRLNTNTNKYKYLCELSVARRLERILEDIEREKQISEIENKINDEV